MTHPRWILLLLCLFAMVIPSAAQSTRDVDAAIQIISDVPYVADGTPNQVLDIFLPPGADTDYDFARPYPTIIMWHGGGFVFGSKRIMTSVAERYAEQGYAVITPGYRLAPAHVYPAAYEDSYCALAWTLANAETYGFDTQEIIMLGESAGANIAMLMALSHESDFFRGDCEQAIPAAFAPEAVVALYMPVELNTCECGFARSLASTFLDVDNTQWENPEEVYANFREASLLHWLEPDNRLAQLPPVFMIHGTDDTVVPISESEQFLAAYSSADGDISLTPLDGASHGFFPRPFSSATQASYELIDPWLTEILRP